MNQETYQRRLAALISADVAGYSRLMSDDEIATIRMMNVCRKSIGGLVEAESGRVVDFVGDNLLAEFPDTLSAIICASRIHDTSQKLNMDLPAARRLQFRIGIHIGDVTVDGDRLYGDGVNIAARLESLAEPGGTCISDLVYRQIHGKRSYHFVDLGERRLKNISQAVRVYRVIEQTAGPVESAMPAVPRQKLKPLSRPAKPSLAVLPFVNLSGNPDQDHLAIGLTIDIQAALVLIPGLFVISGATMANFKSTLAPIQDIGRQLGVSHVLEGGLTCTDDRLRITARLIETGNARQVWAERYEKRLGDIFDVQDEITREITTAMNVQLVMGISGQTVINELKNPKAIEFYYRGYGAIMNSPSPDFHTAFEMFEEAIRLEPDVAIPYSISAFLHVISALYGRMNERDQSLAKAAQLAGQALALKDETGLPELVMAMINLLHNEPEKALQAAEHAVLVRPSCDISYAVKASVLNYLGRSAEAVDLARLAIRLSPVYPAFFANILAAAYCGCQRYEEAVDAVEISLERNPHDFDALIISTIAHAALGRDDWARQWAGILLEVKPNFTTRAFANFYPYKDPAQLKQLIDFLQRAGVP